MTVDRYTPRSGDPSIAVTHYEIELDYRPATNRLAGTATLDIRALTDLRSIALDLTGLRATRASVDGMRATWRQSERKLTVTLPAPVRATGTLAVAIEYEGTPRPRRTRWGLLGWEELADGVLVASQPTGAPTWFPCNDVVADRATYGLSITVDAGYTVVSGGQSRRTTVRGRSRWVSRIGAPTPTYLATVQIGRYTRTRMMLGTVPGIVEHPAGIRSAVLGELATLPAMMTAFEEAFGPYPLPEYTVVVTPDVLEIPLEAQGMAIFGSNHLDGSGAHQRLIAHELAHQWFGNSVGLVRWQDIWLNEGFACYAEWIWSEASGAATTQAQALAHHARLAALPQDLAIGDPGPTLMFDDRVYKRGALALHAVRLTVGDGPFFRTLRTWTSRFAGRSVTTADFLETAEEVTGVPLAGLLRRWVLETPLPALPEPAPIADDPVAPLPLLRRDRRPH